MQKGGEDRDEEGDKQNCSQKRKSLLDWHKKGSIRKACQGMPQVKGLKELSIARGAIKKE